MTKKPQKEQSDGAAKGERIAKVMARAEGAQTKKRTGND